MFGIKWLWKSNKTNIDTSNFVSREFLSTTLQDYVNRDLFNTTLSDYITTTSLNNTLANYVSTNTAQTITDLKTFRAAPVGLKLQQASGRSDKQYITFNDSNNTTTFSLGSQLTETSFEANRGNIKFQTQEANKKVIFDTTLVEFNRAVPQFGTEIKAGYGGGAVKFLPEDSSTKTLQFFETNNTSQRRFNLNISEPTEATNPATKNYVDTQLQNTVSTNTNQTISADKTFSNLITITKTNGALAFKPGTNQPAYFEFYNGNTRIGYFGKGSSGNNNMTLGASSGQIILETNSGVVVPQPTQNNNPATKQYVDNAISGIQSGSTIRYRDYQFPDNSSTPSTVGEIVQYSLQINDNGINMNNVIGITANYLNQQYAAEKATYYKVSYSAKSDNSLFISVFTDKFIYTGLSPDSVKQIDFRNFRIRLFYCDNISSRDNQIYQGEIVKLQEIKGGK